MKMTWRWYGEGNDQIKLSDIKQIPGVEGIVWALHDKLPGEVWQPEEIAVVKKQLDEYGFNMDVVESVNVHDDIKIGLPTRDQYIENYKQTIRNLAPFGVKVICYNFMPVFDWTRTDLFHPVGDGSTALYYEASKIHEDPKDMADLVRELKGLGYGVYLLSNAKLDLPLYFDRIPGSECFDGKIVSADWKLLKPQPEIYETLLREYGLRAEECFFIDDLNINIEGAWLVGMDGAIFDGDLPRLRRALNDAGVPVKT